jgi:transcription-repair coupling factor (superfamily II helicase)
VVYLPPPDVVPWTAQVATGPVRDDRLEALHRLGDARPPVVVIAAAALSRLVPPPGALRGRAVPLRLGDSRDPAALARRLALTGYRSVAEVGESGEFSRRGGILDVYGAGMTHPVRVEFDGDVIASMRRFDVSTQRSIQPSEAERILPAREVLYEEDLEARLEAADRAGLPRSLEGERIRDLVAEGVYFEGVDWMAPLLGIPLVSALEHLPPGATVWLDEPDAVERELEHAAQEVERLEPAPPISRPATRSSPRPTTLGPPSRGARASRHPSRRGAATRTGS